MTYREALDDFKANVLPGIPSGDRPAKSEAWCVFVDHLNRDGRITDKQAQEWDNPFGQVEHKKDKIGKAESQYFSLDWLMKQK